VVVIKRGLYLGRFQIFHNGHLHIIKHISQQPDIDEVLINIGSSQYNQENKSPEAPWIINPFSFEERKELIDRSIKNELETPYKIIGVQDHHYCPSWIQQVKYSNPNFQVFFSNTRKEINLFEKQGFETRRVPIKDKFHAQIIREMIAYEDDFSQYVPKGVVEVVEEFGLVKKLRDFYIKHKEEIAYVHNLQKEKNITSYVDMFGDEKVKQMLGL
jgi:nicotinamide-nucleotide adenylyltransferase